MKKAILFAIICILAGACSSPKDQAKASPDGTMFEDIPATFDSSQHKPLHMAVALKADSFLVIGARGGFLPNTYYTVLKELVDPSSDDFPKRKPNVDYVAIQKESEEDPGKIIWGLYSDSNKEYITDSSGAFIAFPGEGRRGAKPSDSIKAIRDKDYPKARIKPLSAFNVIAKDLATVRTRFEFPDKDWIVLILEDGFNKDYLYELRSRQPRHSEKRHRNIPPLRFQEKGTSGFIRRTVPPIEPEDAQDSGHEPLIHWILQPYRLQDDNSRMTSPISSLSTKLYQLNHTPTCVPMTNNQLVLYAADAHHQGFHSIAYTNIIIFIFPVYTIRCFCIFRFCKSFS